MRCSSGSDESGSDDPSMSGACICSDDVVDVFGGILVYVVVWEGPVIVGIHVDIKRVAM